MVRDPGGPKTCGSGLSGLGTLVRTTIYLVLSSAQIPKLGSEFHLGRKNRQGRNSGSVYDNNKIFLPLTTSLVRAHAEVIRRLLLYS
jgi:hypothetical protein